MPNELDDLIAAAGAGSRARKALEDGFLVEVVNASMARRTGALLSLKPSDLTEFCVQKAALDALADLLTEVESIAEYGLDCEKEIESK